MQFERHAYTHEAHVVTFRIHQVCSPPTHVNHRQKLRRDHRHGRQGLLTPPQLARKCRKLHQEYLDLAYIAHAVTAKTIRGRSLFHL